MFPSDSSVQHSCSRQFSRPRSFGERSGVRLSSDVALAAALLPSLELDDPDQIQLYNVADRKLVAATPIPIRQQSHLHGAPLAIKASA